MLLVKNLLTQWETEEENRTRDQLIKNFPTNEGNVEENQMIIDIIDEKIFQPGLKTGKKKPRLVERGETFLRKDLINEGLGQNKVLCGFLEVEPPMVNYHIGFSALLVLRRQNIGNLPTSGSRSAPTQILPCCLTWYAS